MSPWSLIVEQFCYGGVNLSSYKFWRGYHLARRPVHSDVPRIFCSSWHCLALCKKTVAVQVPQTWRSPQRRTSLHPCPSIHIGDQKPALGICVSLFPSDGIKKLPLAGCFSLHGTFFPPIVWLPDVVVIVLHSLLWSDPRFHLSPPGNSAEQWHCTFSYRPQRSAWKNTGGGKEAEKHPENRSFLSWSPGPSSWVDVKVPQSSFKKRWSNVQEEVNCLSADVVFSKVDHLLLFSVSKGGGVYSSSSWLMLLSSALPPEVQIVQSSCFQPCFT